MLGSWDVNVSTNYMPQKIATAFEELNEMIGAEYTFIAYLGCQVVNGTNHAVLAEQKLVLGKDAKNVVLIIFHETKEGVTLSSIERVIESNGELGDIEVNVETKINDDAMGIFNKAFEEFCGNNIVPFALLGTQVVHGINYIFACTITPVIPNANSKVAIITVNTAGFEPQIVDLQKTNKTKVNIEKTNLRIAAPWTIFYKEVYALFNHDPDVEVMYNYEEPELKIWVKGNDNKAAALSRFIPKEKRFGNVVLNISVVGGDGQPVPDINCTNIEAINIAFENNRAVKFIKNVQTMFGDIITYVVFRRDVVQYYADNMTDLYGVVTTIYQDIAKNIFADTLGLTGSCFFCTEILDKLNYAFSW